MDITGIGSIASLVETGINKIWPDKTEQQKAAAAEMMAELQGQIEMAKAQLDVNKTEAASNSVFVAGWRPFVGWVCGAAFAYAFVVQPVLQFALVALHVDFDAKALPILDFAQLQPILYGMLGFGAMRTVEKVNGVKAGH